MHATITSKNQITIPMTIAIELGLHKGDIVSVTKIDNKIVLTPQTLEDKYPEALLRGVEEKLKQGPLPGEKKFSSTAKLLKDLKA